MLNTIKALATVYDDALIAAGHDPIKLRENYNAMVVNADQIEMFDANMAGNKEYIYGEIKGIADDDRVVKLESYYLPCYCDDYCGCPRDEIFRLLAFNLVGNKIRYIHMKVVKHDLSSRFCLRFPIMSRAHLAEHQYSLDMFFEVKPELIRWLASEFGYEPIIAAYE